MEQSPASGQPGDIEECPSPKSTDSSQVRVLPRELAEKGILYQLNRQILHPLGLEMTFIDDHLYVDKHASTPAGVIFTDEEMDEGAKMFVDYMRTEGFKVVTARVDKYGYVVQGGLDGV